MGHYEECYEMDEQFEKDGTAEKIRKKHKNEYWENIAKVLKMMKKKQKRKK